MKKEFIKDVLIGAALFSVAVCSNIVANSLYTKTRIGADKKTALTASVVGVGVILFATKVILGKKRVV